MEICNVCEKKTLLPEKLGNISICKICFLKVKGVMWKKNKIESKEELDNMHKKAITLANKNNFPTNVIDGINIYFDEKLSELSICNACKDKKLTIIKMNNSNICKSCYSKVNIKEWKNKKYISKNQLMNDKNKIIDIANKNNFPQEAIDYIEKDFCERVDEKWWYTIDGKKGQILKVYDDYFVINTTNEFDIDLIAEEYATIYNEDHPKKEVLSKEETQSFIGDLLGGTGGLVKDVFKMGIKGKITSRGLDYMIDKYEKKIESSMETVVGNAYDRQISEKRDFRKYSGEIKYNYSDFEIIEYRDIGQDELGYLKFQNKHTLNNIEFDILFFYGSDTKKEERTVMTDVYSFIYDKIKASNKMKENDNNISKSNSVADELLKFKQLLDMGGITEEEYNKKKEELLDL